MKVPYLTLEWPGPNGSNVKQVIWFILLKKMTVLGMLVSDKLHQHFAHEKLASVFFVVQWPEIEANES